MSAGASSWESHLGETDQKLFTRAYVAVLCRNVPWLQAHGAHWADDLQADNRDGPPDSPGLNERTA